MGLKPKITYFKVVNSIGIYNGTGMTELEIDFSKSTSKKILIKGGNGSGKSTLLSMLTPFKDSFDNRKNLYLDGKDGEKIIGINYNGHDYLIQHKYKAKENKTFSHIEKDGVELNKNGLDGDFRRLIKTELGLDEDYILLGRNGAGSDSFVSYKSAPRKQYINELIPQISRYNEYYTTVNDKLKIEKKRLADVSTRLRKYSDIEVLKREVDNIQSSINIENNKSEELTTLIANNKALQTIERNIMMEHNINNEKSMLINLNDAYNTASALLSENTLDTDTLNNMLDLNNKKLNNYNVELATLNNQVQNDKKAIVENNNKIIEHKANLKDYSNDDLEKATKSLNDNNAKIIELEKSLSSADIYNSIDNFDTTISNQIVVFETLFDTLYNNHAILNKNTINETANINILFGGAYSETVNNYSNCLKKQINDNTICINNANNKQSLNKSNLGQLSILDKRPLNCAVDDCPFIVNALKFKNLPDEIKLLDEDITRLNNEHLELNNKSEEFANLLDVYKQIINQFKLMNKENKIYLYFVSKYGNIAKSITTLSKDDFKIAYTNVVKVAHETIDIYNQIQLLKTQNIQLQTSISSISSYISNSKYFYDEINKLEKANIILAENNSSNEARITEITADINNINFDNKSINNKLDALKNIASIKQQIDDLNKGIEEYNVASTKYNNFASTIYNLEKQLILVKGNIKNLTNSLNTKNIELSNANELKKELDILDKSFSIIKTVKEALDPKSGIPLIFIQSYLDNVERLANKLLAIAYNGEFQIKFNVTEKDFFISVRHNDSFVEDIALCSQGEIALTTISISLALIEQSMGEYNILYLDEIDGPLDKSNRQAFIDILDSQIEQLGIEQVFIISHNDVFDQCDLDLILLKKHNFRIDDEQIMSNKNIIFNLYDTGYVDNDEYDEYDDNGELLTQ